MSTQKLEALKLRQQELKRQIATLETRVRESNRKLDTRKKILLGAYLLAKCEREQNFDAILAEMDKYLTHDRDRKIFNLPPKAQEETP